jgi:hypothetical protein
MAPLQRHAASSHLVEIVVGTRLVQWMPLAFWLAT